MSIRVFFWNGALVADWVGAIVASVKAIHVARTIVNTVVDGSDTKRLANSFGLISFGFFFVNDEILFHF